jgi:hypothetical protein
MNFNQKVLEMNQKIFDIISTKSISFLYDLDNRIDIIKNGKFKYYKIFCIEEKQIINFLQNLDDKKIYSLIPLISINDRRDQPFTVLSQTILITKESDPLLIYNYLNNKIDDTINLFNIDTLNSYFTILKYKQIEINFNEYKKFE